MAFGAVTHRQDVIGPDRGFIPGGSQRHVAANEVFAGQCFDPGEPIRIGPHRVVHASEVGVELAPAIKEEVRQQNR